MIEAAAVIAIATTVYKVAEKAIEVVKSPQFQAFWKVVKDLFSAKPKEPTLTAQELDSRRTALEAELNQSIEDACPLIPVAQQRAFASRATKMVGEVLNNCMQGVDGADRSPVLEATFAKAAENARQLVAQHRQAGLNIEREQLDAPSVRRVMVQNPDDPQGPRVQRLIMLRNAPPIENLVLRGGRAEGIGNAPALRALENLGKLSELKKIVGTSGGTLAAVCLASGMTAGQFQTLCDDSSMNSMRATSADFASRYPEVKLGSPSGATAGNALEIMDQSTATSVFRYLNSHWESIEQKEMSPTERNRLKDLKDLQDVKEMKDGKFAGTRTRQMITFGDLALLHRLVPEKFKPLVLTGYNESTKKTVYFSADTHRDMPVALAGRIAMSLPVFFKPVEMTSHDGEKHHFVGGGLDNIPAEVIGAGGSEAKLQEATAKTLLMACDESGHGYSIMRRQGGDSEDGFPNAPAGRKFHAADLNVLPVYHGKLSSLSPGVSAEEIEKAQTRTLLKAMEHIENVMGGLRHDLVEDERAAARLLSVKEQDRFLKKFGSSAAPLDISMCNAIRALRQLPQQGNWPGAAA